MERYEIERDERDKGGKLSVIASFTNYQAAMVAWREVSVPDDEDVQIWLVKNGRTVIDVKCK